MRAAFAAFAAFAASLIALAIPRVAAADGGRTSSLSWLRMPGADSCIATQALARSVEERLGRHVFVSAAEADVSVEGRIEKRAGTAPGWRSVITIRDSKGALLGTRELDRPEASCASMNEPLALVIAVMIDPEAKLSSTPAPLPPPATVAAPAPPPLPAATAPAAPVAAEPETPKPRAKDPWRFQGDAVGTVSTGLAPEVAFGGSIAGTLFLPTIPLGFRGYASLFAPTNATQDGARASFDLFYLGGAVCPTLRRTAITLMLCFGGHLGVVRSHPETQGRNIDDKTGGLWNAVSEARITIPIAAPLAITGGISGVLPLLRPTFGYTRSDSAQTPASLHRVASFAMAADVGIGFFFP